MVDDNDHDEANESYDSYTQHPTVSVFNVEPDLRADKHTHIKCEEEHKRKQRCTEVDDEYDAIGVNVAAKLRALPSNMSILAEKLINDVLYKAQTNDLSSSSFVTTPDPFK